MAAEYSIRTLLERGEFVWAPCIYDCLSARCAELVGHNAVLISSCELEYAMNGIWNKERILTWDLTGSSIFVYTEKNTWQSKSCIWRRQRDDNKTAGIKSRRQQIHRA